VSDVHRVRRPLGGDSNEEEIMKVIETFKYNVVWTVSGGGYVERKEYSQSEPYRTASARRGKQEGKNTRKVKRIGRPLQGEAKVTKTVKISPMWTVSGGGWAEERRELAHQGGEEKVIIYIYISNLWM
jgi:hypothetical protein